MKIEKLPELSKICQKPNYRTVGNWMVRHFERDAALPITWLLLHTPATANQVTLVALLIGISSGFFMANPSGPVFFFGTMLLQFWYLLDHVDGQIARYRKSTSFDGVFFDFIMHHIVGFVPLFAAGWSLFVRSGSEAALLLGFIASVSHELIALLNDCRAKALYSYILTRKSGTKLAPITQAPVDVNKQPKYTPDLRRIFSFLHKTCEAHVVMNVLTVLGLFLWIAGDEPFMDSIFWCLMFYYAVVSMIVWSSKLAFWVRSGEISRHIAEAMAEEKS